MTLKKTGREKALLGLKKIKIFLLTLPFQTFMVSPVRAFVVTEVDFLSAT
jgi:hypothetical protein